MKTPEMASVGETRCWSQSGPWPAWSRGKSVWGFTLVEILVTFFLAVAMIGAAILIWGRTGRTVQKGEEMMDLQTALRSINDGLRSDVRTLLTVKSCQKHKVSFVLRRKGKEATLSYEFDAAANTLWRKGGDGPETDFHAAGLVKSVEFATMPSAADFEYLQVALELESLARKGTPASRLAVMNQFSSRSKETPFEVVK